MNCRHLDEVRRASAGQLSPDLHAHVDDCPVCTAERVSIDELAGLFGEPAPLTNDQVTNARAQVLLSTQLEQEPPRSWSKIVGLAVAGLIVAFGTVALFANRTHDEPKVEPLQVRHWRADISHDNATFTHDRSVSNGVNHDEVVRLERGRIRLKVHPLAKGERFRVKTQDAQVEVWGTTFEVKADRGRLQSVRVDEGVVQVRHEDHPPIVLRAGQEWTRPPQVAAAVADAGVRRIVRAAKKPKVEAVRKPPRRTPASEQAFNAGMDALRAGDYARALEELSRARRAPMAGPLARDAQYWQAIARARSGATQTAKAEMKKFLDDHPTSPRAGTLRVAAGWLHLDDGELDRAEVLFREAKDDAVASVRERAERGLRAVAKRRTR